MSITANDDSRPFHTPWPKTRWGRALIAGLAAALACSACTSQPPATVSAPATLPEVAGLAPTATPPTLATLAPTPTPPPVATLAATPTPNLIRVAKVMPEKKVTSNEQYKFDNCGGIVEVRRPFSDAAQVWTEVTISDQATCSDGTTIPVSEALRSQLMDEVHHAYQKELDAARAAVEQIEMVAGAQTIWDITVIWEDSVFAASVSFPSDGMTAMAAYTYTQHVPTMGSQKPMPCSG